MDLFRPYKKKPLEPGLANHLPREFSKIRLFPQQNQNYYLLDPRNLTNVF